VRFSAIFANGQESSPQRVLRIEGMRHSMRSQGVLPGAVELRDRRWHDGTGLFVEPMVVRAAKPDVKLMHGKIFDHLSLLKKPFTTDAPGVSPERRRPTASTIRTSGLALRRGGKSGGRPGGDQAAQDRRVAGAR